MPVYEYECEAGHQFEVTQKISDAPITACQVCDLPVTKLVSASAIMFKGSGWYVTDYSDKLKTPATEEKGSAPPECKPQSTNEGAEKPAASPPAPSPTPSEPASPPSSKTESA